MANLAKNSDRITDFASGLDQIVLGRTGSGPFDTIGFGVLAAQAFRVGAQATTAAHRVIYDQSDGRLYHDPDGTGAAARVQFALLEGAPTLVAGDFLVI